MLNFTVTMAPWESFSRLILGFWLIFTNPRVAVPESITIISPKAGDAVQGVVAIIGTTQLTGFRSAEVSFTYSSSSVRSWFSIGESQEPVTIGTIVTWDTTSITDGIYDLRLVVTLKDGSHPDVLVQGVRIRNYTPIENRTPLPTLSGNTLEPTLTALTLVIVMVPTATTQIITQTALPTNPAGLNERDLFGSVWLGGLVVLGLFFAIWIYSRLRTLLRH
jgi:hypothetical protein